MLFMITFYLVLKLKVRRPGSPRIFPLMDGERWITSHPQLDPAMVDGTKTRKDSGMQKSRLSGSVFGLAGLLTAATGCVVPGHNHLPGHQNPQGGYGSDVIPGPCKGKYWCHSCFTGLSRPAGVTNLLAVVTAGPPNNSTNVPQANYELRWAWDIARSGCASNYDGTAKQFNAPLLGNNSNRAPNICIFFHPHKCPGAWVSVVLTAGPNGQ